jgi:phage shock protein A
MSNENNNKPMTEGQCRASERARLAAILEHPHAEARPKVAKKLALYTALSSEAVIEMLADLPEEKETRADASHFLEAMNREGSTGVASALGTAPTGDAKSHRLAEIKEAGVRYNLSAGYISPKEAVARGLVVKGI